MENLGYAFVFYVLAAIPVVICMRRRDDKTLRVLFSVVSFLFFPCVIASTWLASSDVMLRFSAVPYLLHWSVWLWMAYSQANVRKHVLPLLTVLLLLMNHAVLFGNLAVLVLAVIYMAVAVFLCIKAKKQKTAETEEKFIGGIFRGFSPLSYLYINDRLKEQGGEE